MIESFILGIFSFISAFIISNIILFFVKNAKELQGYVNGDISSQLAFLCIYSFYFDGDYRFYNSCTKCFKTDPVELIQGNKI